MYKFLYKYVNQYELFVNSAIGTFGILWRTRKERFHQRIFKQMGKWVPMGTEARGVLRTAFLKKLVRSVLWCGAVQESEVSF